VGLLATIQGWFGGKKGKGKGRVRDNTPRIDLNKRFELLGRTGQGSMSKVWRARDKSLGRMVCLKILDKEKTAKFEARFVGMNKPREGIICTVLRHKNIVQTLEHGMSTQGEPFLVMELVDGMGLNFLIETRSPQLEGNRVTILSQLADGLEYMHKQGFLHRDICPRNVMVTKDNVVKLIDFGLAIPNTPEFLKPGNRTGTPNYLAPEVIRRTSTDLRVDMFALGVTAYEVYTATLPWEKAQSLQTLLSHMNSVGKDPREVCPKMDKATAEFLLKAIERDPRDRFQTAEDFREAVLRLPKA
jgi:serine/threonine protein kinase